MILGPISYLDCFIFCIFLAPQLLLRVGLFETLGVALQCLPFLLFQLPFEFLRERFLLSRTEQSPFVQVASPFEDFVIRCVRYAFANIPPKVGRVFFSKPVALPFLRFRMLRHGILKKPVHWHEHVDKRFKGIWIIKDPLKRPDVCIYYAHGGGFSMGSSYFYLEFLLTWLGMLEESGFHNPAIFALEYTLVPDGTFPKQIHEAIAGYDHVVSMVGDASKICVSGDSAGATVLLSLLLHIADRGFDQNKMNESGAWRLPKPGMAAFISPWVTLISKKHQNTASDYLDGGNLHQYAREYVGKHARTDDPMISPGNCRDASWWKRACPEGGLYFAYGAEEVFASEIESLVKFLEDGEIKVGSREEPGGIHAWPVAALFLANSIEDRQKGLRTIVRYIRESIP
ncbi:putative Alpha/Beta hydrolase protein [Seiridium unicorne]|uniref:Alpha/Beta hydrolase protein n=1 Tax=Seiridium unicorne TaxID=138068 RepID=A0ABR2UHP2_9PEZI